MATATHRPLWICPKCGARLVSRNLWHSCGQFTLEALFADSKPEVLAAARTYVVLLSSLGDVKILPQKTRLVAVARVRWLAAAQGSFHGQLCPPSLVDEFSNTVIEAEEGVTAVTVLKNDSERIDAVVHDYRLPDSNDLTLLATVTALTRQRRRPDDRLRHARSGERGARCGRLPRAAQTIRPEAAAVTCV